MSTEPSQHWLVESAPNGLRFSHGFLFLSCDSANGSIVTKEISEMSSVADTATWILEPCLPGTLRGSRVWNMVGIGAVTLAAAFVAPMAVTGVIGALGFGAEGIMAGSVAAGMMSAEAAASGGAIAAGGTVATLQSIGAAGLGVAGTTASMSGGALVGGGIAAETSKVVSKDKDSKHDDDDNGNTLVGMTAATARDGTDEDKGDDDNDTFISNTRSFAAWKDW